MMVVITHFPSFAYCYPEWGLTVEVTLRGEKLWIKLNQIWRGFAVSS